MFITVLAGVELVNIYGLARSSTGLAEYDFTQSANFLHHIGGIMRRDDVDLVVAFVGHSQLLVGCQLTLEDFLADGSDDGLFHCKV